MKLLVIVPAYNEAPVIFKTLQDIKQTTQKLDPDIVVVNDGSKDLTEAEAKRAKVVVLTHRINRGLGGAIGTGLEYAKRHDYDLAVTIDADGQHDPKDIQRVIQPITEGRADVVIGSRFKTKQQHMPLDRKLLLMISNALTWALFGRTATDSLSGFRAFNKKAIQYIRLKTERMEVSNELFAEIKRLNLSLEEVPIQVLYTDYSRAKGQTNANALNIVFKLILRLFR